MSEVSENCYVACDKCTNRDCVQDVKLESGALTIVYPTPSFSDSTRYVNFYSETEHLGWFVFDFDTGSCSVGP